MQSLDSQLWHHLREIIDTYGADICGEHRRFEGLLRDQCGQYRREIRLLINALKEGVVSRLRAADENTPVELLLPQVCKKIQEDLMLSPEAAEWAVRSWAAALGLVPGLSTEQSGRAELDSILRSQHYTPDRLIEFFEGEFGKELAADAGVWEEYTVKRHTAMVMYQFEKYFGAHILPGGFASDTFRVILVLHDIGVSHAIAEGAKHGIGVKDAKKAGQPTYTAKLMEAAMENLGFGRSEIDVARALVSDDPIGSYLRGSSLPTVSIRRMAQQSGMALLDFFDLLLIFYMVDAGSYTEDAGGRKALDALFVFDRTGMKMTFSPETKKRIDVLRRSLEW